MSEFEGTLPDAGTPDGNLDSPNLPDDTHGADLGSEGSRGTDDGELTSLRSELEELRKRVSGQTLSWQQERQKAEAERQKREALESKLDKWRKAGVDPDVIDQEIERLAGGAAQQTNQQVVPQNDPNIMTREEFETARILDKWEIQKETYFERNPEYDTEEFRTFFDTSAGLITRKELQEYGRIVSTPKDVAKKAEQSMKKLFGHIEKVTQKKLTETREKVNAQGVIESKHQKTRVESNDDPNTPMSKEEYIGMFRKHRERLISRS